MVYFVQKSVFIVERSFKTNSIEECKGEFHGNFPEENVPSKSSIQLIVKRFSTTGPVTPLKWNYPTIAVSDEKLNEIRELIIHSPKTSARGLAKRLSVNRESYRTAVQHLKLKPYKISVVHQLRLPDFAAGSSEN